MADVQIGTLKLNIAGAAGHEHRVSGVAKRAADLFAARSLKRFGPAKQDLRIESVAGQPVSIDWGSASDEEAAGIIADAWLQAIPNDSRRL